MDLQQDLEEKLKEILPSAMHPIIGEFAEFLLSLQYNQLSPEEGSSRLTTETSIAHALHHLANHEKSIQTKTSQIQFGEGNQFGDLTFRDVIGGDVYHVHMPLSSSTTLREQNIMFKITRPQEEEVFTKEVILNGTGGKPEECIRIISWVLENGCYIRPGIILWGE
jgi:hypothetical protein